MPGGQYRPLGDDDLTRIHEAALTILENTGIGDPLPELLDIVLPLGAKQIANRTASEAFGVAFSFVICILIGTVGGFVLDRAVGTKPLFFLVGFFAGFALGVWYMIFKARQVAQREEE